MHLLDSILRDLDLIPDTPPAAPPPATPPAAPPEPANEVEPTSVAPPPPAQRAAVASRSNSPRESRATEADGSEGRPSPYLEERLTSALHAIAEVREEMRDMALRSQAVRDTVGAVEVELERSMRELEFLRAQHGRVPLPPAPLPARGARSFSPAVASSRPPGRGRYAEFTVDRYNRTMTRVKARRRRMAGWMVVLATLISIGLVAVDLAFPNPQPAWWLGILPAVWIIPVPFFALSFRGTQRVLRRNHFDLPGEA